MKLFRKSKLVGKLERVKLLNGDKYNDHEGSAECCRVEHRGLAIVRICWDGRIDYGTSGAGEDMSPVEWTKRVNYYLGKLGQRNIDLIERKESGFKNL